MRAATALIRIDRVKEKTHRRRIVLNVSGPHPIRGSLEERRGDRRAFTGWIGLLSALQQLLSERTSAASREIEEER
jgi:hypothetical protein